MLVRGGEVCWLEEENVVGQRRRSWFVRAEDGEVC